MSNAWLNTVFADRETTGGERLVLLAIADRAADDGCCYCGYGDLSTRVNLSVRQCRSIVASLTTAGKLATTRGGGRGNANEYRLLSPSVNRNSEAGRTLLTPETVKPVAPFPSRKGEVCDTERVKSGAERVKSGALKGEARFTPTNRTQLTLKRTPSARAGEHFDAHVLEVYEAYPRKEGRRQALYAIYNARMPLRHNRADADAYLLERTKLYAAAVADWPLEERQFIPHPATWFNDLRFNHDPATWKRTPRRNGRAAALPASLQESVQTKVLT